MADSTGTGSREPVPYHEFRSGWNFESVRAVLAQEQTCKAASGERMFVSRRTVLGRLRQYKREAYAYYLQGGDDCCCE